MRRAVRMLAEAGFADVELGSHGYVQVTDPADALSVVQRGADALVAQGVLGPQTGEALKAEAARRVEAGSCFGHVAYTSAIAPRPGRSPARFRRQPARAASAFSRALR